MYKRTIDQNVRTILFSQSVMGLEDWTHEGRFVIYMPDAKSIWACPQTGDRKPFRCALGRHEPTSRRWSFRYPFDDRHSGAHNEDFVVVTAAVSGEQQESVVGRER